MGAERDALILHHLPVVESVADSLIRSGIPRHYRDDLISEGTIALILVIDEPSQSPVPLHKRIARRAKDAMVKFWVDQKRYVPVGLMGINGDEDE